MVTIIVAIITGVCSAAPTLIATITGNRKNKELMEYRINELAEKVEKHNSVIERTFRLEEKVANVERTISEINSKIK